MSLSFPKLAFTLSLTCLLGTAALQGEEERYLLRGHPTAEPGVLVKYEGVSKMRDGKVYSDTGEDLGFAYMSNILNLQWESISPTKVRILLSKGFLSLSSQLQPEPIVVENTLVDHVVEGNLVGDLWKFTLAEGEPTEEQRDRLLDIERAAYSDFLMYPTKPMAIGETYEIPADVISIGLEPEAVLLDEPTGTLTLVDVVDYEGHRCAKIQLDTTLHMQYLDEGGSRIFKIKDSTLIYRTLDTFIELYEEESSEMEIRFQYDWGFIRQVGTMKGDSTSVFIEAA